MFKALKKFNFGDSFIKWVRLLYTNISSCIMNHGTTTPYFHLERGTRQGDPLSGYLFVIALELLSEALRSSNKIDGIKIGDATIKLTQYVDDLTIFVSNEQSARQVFSILELFRIASGLRVNKDKSEGIWLGQNMNFTSQPFDIKLPKDPIRGFGCLYII